MTSLDLDSLSLIYIYLLSSTMLSSLSRSITSTEDSERGLPLVSVKNSKGTLSSSIILYKINSSSIEDCFPFFFVLLLSLLLLFEEDSPIKSSQNMFFFFI
ncbi:hypothetical protein BCR36DRAFT_4471 [Piromyces finnis]|uniref:Uncharacterized protein n=1 Tax=Piromyces finnis TaxID=1754191 RepID=A0A1Y1VNI8_9FUNG|nr:hypothetical protein BCR36DRAFT_4471 [Piromyces finnis]|eukprot:ORX60976.1 hypothetical protein BCR36DRAFT_4471 [Piromyces finnis]